MSDQRYIGSRISLVSKSDIRYIGILHALDPQNATLSLKEVVSQGTEGRRGGNPADEIPPSDTVFRYIVFRGSDIKDLSVFDLPPQQKQQQQQQTSPPFGAENNNNTQPSYPSYHVPGPQMMLPTMNQQQQQYFQPYPPTMQPFPYAGYEPYVQQHPGPHGFPHLPHPLPPPPSMSYPDYYLTPQPTANETPFLNGSSLLHQQQQQLQQNLPMPMPMPMPMQMPIPPEPVHKPEMMPAIELPTPTTPPSGADISQETPNQQLPQQQKHQEIKEPKQQEPATKPDLKENENIKPDLKDKSPTPSDKKVKKKADPLPTPPARTESLTDAMVTSVEQLAKTVSELGIAKDRKDDGMFSEKRNSRQKQQNGDNSSSSSNSNGRNNSKTIKKSTVSLPEFDFASANAKFDKEQVLRNLLENGRNSSRYPHIKKKDALVVIPEADAFYDKSKSFFDDISCDAKERAEAKKTKNDDYRKKHQEEKKLNLETFGEVSVETTGRNHTRVGGGSGHQGRGGRGRGYHQGRSSRSNGKRVQSTRA